MRRRTVAGLAALTAIAAMGGAAAWTLAPRATKVAEVATAREATPAATSATSIATATPARPSAAPGFVAEYEMTLDADASQALAALADPRARLAPFVKARTAGRL